MAARKSTSRALRAIAKAPTDDEPESASERRRVARARREIARGETITHAELEQRLGVGRPPKSDAGAGVMLSIRVAPDDRAELRELAKHLDVTQTDILLWGLDTARRKAARR